MNKRKHRSAKWTLIGLLVLVPAVVGMYHRLKPMPEQYSMKSPLYPVDQVDFLHDLTYETKEGRLTHKQEIMKEAYQMINQAQDYLIIDMFLFNDDYDHQTQQFPAVAQTMTDKLIAKKQASGIPIYFITDPINSFYGTYTPKHIQALKDAGITVVETNLSALRDSNPLYAGLYRSYFAWFGQSNAGFLPNAFRTDGPKVNFLSYLQLLNFKANHRKTLANEQEALITSANPHDGSAYHSNIAFKLKGPILKDLLQSELAVIKDAGLDTQSIKLSPQIPDKKKDQTQSALQVGLISEGKIKERLLQCIQSSRTGDKLHLGLFYLSDRDIIQALKEAANRKVQIQLILDINQDAFGKKKMGIPNRPVAHELSQASPNIQIRWYQSHGEQYHAKFMIKESAEQVEVIGGSANFTQRNLADLNLETDVYLVGKSSQKTMQEILTYYRRIWTNEDGQYTVAYQTYAEDSWWKTALYRLQEWSGLSTF
ncbi:phospholipase D family protein [Vaginisenegalia massiliensis]|uniref:phospholipase D family protein n=1 Tax=Vaginisenegalia massiliensis TaxID=2058294 RepID=UPI0019D1E3F6|nr:phospholipase D family protein [Vaginisenegalia massiliensis]